MLQGKRSPVVEVPATFCGALVFAQEPLGSGSPRCRVALGRLWTQGELTLAREVMEISGHPTMPKHPAGRRSGTFGAYPTTGDSAQVGRRVRDVNLSNLDPIGILTGRA